MRLFDLISMTLRNLLRRKARTLLTMMGAAVSYTHLTLPAIAIV